MKLFIRSKTVPGRPLLYHQTNASLISWLFRFPGEVIKQLLLIVWNRLKEFIKGFIHVIVFTILTLLIFRPEGGFNEALDMHPHWEPLDSLAISFVWLLLIATVPLSIKRALSLIRRTYWFKLPQRRLRRRR